MGRHTEVAHYNVNSNASRRIQHDRDGAGKDTERGDLIDAKLSSDWEDGGRLTVGGRPNRMESNHPNTKDSRWSS